MSELGVCAAWWLVAHSTTWLHPIPRHSPAAEAALMLLTACMLILLAPSLPDPRTAPGRVAPLALLLPRHLIAPQCRHAVTSCVRRA